jgi:molecular chaperone DnaK (HSP70)
MFDQITKHLLDRTIELTREMLAEAAAKGDTHYDKIILVGGATRMPQIHDRLVAEFELEPESFDPDESVAKGAALFGLKEALQDELREQLAPAATGTAGENGHSEASEAEIDITSVSPQELEAALDRIEQEIGLTLTGPVRELVGTHIVNVLSKSLGVIAKNGEGQECVVYLLNRNCEVPMDHVMDFGTDQANQIGADIRVMAGERDSPEPLDCQEVGTATLHLPPGLPAKSPIRVRLGISRDGRLNVTATDLTGGGSIEVEFETEAVLSASDVEERSSALRMLQVS